MLGVDLTRLTIVDGFCVRSRSDMFEDIGMVLQISLYMLQLPLKFHTLFTLRYVFAGNFEPSATGTAWTGAIALEGKAERLVERRGREFRP